MVNCNCNLRYETCVCDELAELSTEIAHTKEHLRGLEQQVEKVLEDREQKQLAFN